MIHNGTYSGFRSGNMMGKEYYHYWTEIEKIFFALGKPVKIRQPVKILSLCNQI